MMLIQKTTISCNTGWKSVLSFIQQVVTIQLKPVLVGNGRQKKMNQGHSTLSRISQVRKHFPFIIISIYRFEYKYFAPKMNKPVLNWT